MNKIVEITDIKKELLNGLLFVEQNTVKSRSVF